MFSRGVKTLRKNKRSYTMKPSATFKRTGLRILQVLGYTLAFLALPAAVGVVTGTKHFELRKQTPPSFTADLEPPVHEPNKPTVAIVMSNDWTEITDFLGPYAVLTTSEAYNVYALAPERKLSTLNGVLDVMPEYSFAEFEARGLKPDMIVVPYITNIRSAVNAPILDWLREQRARGTKVLSICIGAEVVAASGVLDGHKATTHWSEISRLEKEYPNVEWTRGVRYLDDGDIMSSAGVTSGIDATLYVLKKLNGEAMALEVAQTLNYPHTRFLGDPTRPVPTTIVDMIPLALYTAFRWDKPMLGVTLYDGVSELELASILDTYPTAGAATTVTLADERKPFTTKHGLTIVPRSDFANAPKLNRVIVPGINPTLTQDLEAFANEQGLELETPHVTFAGTEARYPFDAAFSDLAKHENKAIARTVSLGLEYPIDHLQLEGKSFPFFLLARLLGLGLAGVLLVIGLSRGITTLRKTRANTIKQSRTASPVS
jgi:putative intracellular protease/amidase